MGTFVPHANIVAAVLIFIVGFCFHWIGQFLSLVSWDLATRLGLQEKGLPSEYKVYEHAIAVADTAVGWLYGVVAVGLIINADWGYKLAWIPGSIGAACPQKHRAVDARTAVCRCCREPQHPPVEDRLPV